MRGSLAFSVRDLVPHSDLSERPVERDLKLHHVAQAQLRRKYRTFKSEAPLSAVIEVDGRAVTVSGRLDGYRRTPKGVVLYEIKSVPGDPRSWIGSSLLENARRQLQLYGDLARAVVLPPWGNASNLDGVLCLVGDNQKLAIESVDVDASSGILQARLKVVLSAVHFRERPASDILRLLNAFVAQDSREDRPAQQEAARQLEQAADETRLLLSMPPGSGKTRIAVRFSLRESLTRDLPLYWITSKARGREEVSAELDRCRAAGVPLRVLWKTVPERLCHCAMPGSSCPRRLATRSALFLDPLTEIRRRPSWSPSDIAASAEARSLCPHEVSAAIENSADVIIADVNYVLNPSRLTARDSVLVLDEAQHIARRIRDNSRVRIRREELLEWMHSLPETARKSIRELLNARAGSEDGSDSTSELVLRAADQTARFPGAPVLLSLRRAAHLISDLAGDFVIAWSRKGAESSLIGVATDERAALEDVLESRAWVLALSGSLPADEASRRILFPLSAKFHALEVSQTSRLPVAIVPRLVFKYPLTSEDHAAAVSLLCELREHFRPTIAVFGQNRASNEMLSMSLRVRGHMVLLDEDLGGDWSVALASRPDFLFIAMGGSLSESVNPPPGLLTAAAVLSPAYLASDEFDLLRSAARSGFIDRDPVEDDDTLLAERRAEAFSRVIQAAGRLQRSPQDCKPVFLLNRDFSEPASLRSWPRSWYRESPHELVFDSLRDACAQLNPVPNEA